MTLICMRKGLKKEIRIYLSDIKYLMPGDSGTKRKYLSGLKEEILDFASENEDASIADITEHFGEKETVARLYMDTLDVKTVKRKLNIKRAVTAGLLIAIIIWGVLASIGAAVSRTESENGYVISGQLSEESIDENI